MRTGFVIGSVRKCILIVRLFHLISERKTMSNDYPVVGILAQEASKTLKKLAFENCKSFISASYVKFLEAAGARVVPIWIGQDYVYYEEIMNKINGILLPGGACWFDTKDGFADAGEHILKIANMLNEQNDYFPLWGTCLGYELLLYLSDEKTEHRDDCDSHDQQLNLDFKHDFRESKMFKNAPEFVIDILKSKGVTANYHRFCITEQAVSESTKLAPLWRVIASNKDVNGKEFISVIESKRYPYYGVQFHPEKSIFEWSRKEHVDHSMEAVIANRYFADFFVNETRKSRHRFSDEQELTESLIYNFPVTFTAGCVKYFQCYFFP